MQTSEFPKITQVDVAIDNNELALIEKCIERRWLSEGPFAEELKKTICEFTGSKYACFAPNGTLGLYLALLALDLPKGSEIIIPSFTFYASATSAIFAGLKPVFLDVKLDTYNLDPSKIEKLITPNTKAIMPVHIYGQACDMTAVLEIAKKYNLKVVEDAAQGLGVFHKGKHTGTIGDVGVISFFSDKVLTMGEGAVLLAQDEKVFERLKLIRNQGRPNSGVFVHPELGMNFRITDMQAAICTSQFKKFETIKNHRLNLWNFFSENLKGVGDITPMKVDTNSNLVPFRFAFTTKYKTELENFFKENNVETRGFFYPMHLQPKLKETPALSLPASEQLNAEGLCLPVHQHIDTPKAERIVQVIKDFYKKK